MFFLRMRVTGVGRGEGKQQKVNQLKVGRSPAVTKKKVGGCVDQRKVQKGELMKSWRTCMV